MDSASFTTASLAEGQGLLAQRRGRVRTWMKEEPHQVNIVLAIINVGYQLLSFTFLFLLSAVNLSPPGWWFMIGTLLVAIGLTGAIFYRQKFPTLFLFLGVAADFAQVALMSFDALSEATFPSPSGMTGIIFLYTLATKYSWKRILLVVLLYTLSAIVSPFFLGFSTGFVDFAEITVEMGDNSSKQTWIAFGVMLLITAAMFLFMNLLIVLVAHQVRKNRDFENEIMTSFVKSQQLATTEERNRIAREMHDVVSHSLTVMIALSDGARIVGKKDPQRADEVLGELSKTGRSALADMRRTLGVLRDPTGDSAPLAPAEGWSESAVENLSQLAESFAATGLPVTFEHAGEDVPADNNLRLSLYRIVQESLTNALRYGQNIRKVVVRLEVQLPDIYVSVIHDGSATVLGSSYKTGQLNNLGSGKGLAGMRERVAFYGGTIDAGENELGGWTVAAHLRWES